MTSTKGSVFVSAGANRVPGKRMLEIPVTERKMIPVEGKSWDSGVTEQVKARLPHLILWRR